MEKNICKTFLISFLIIFSHPLSAVVNDKIIFGGDDASPPFEWRENRAEKGFTIDIADKLAKRAGRQAIHNLGNWSDMMDALASGEIDVLPMYISEDRQDDFLFSSPFYFVEHAIYASDTNKNQISIEALSNKTVAVEENYYSYENLIKNHPDIRVVPKTTTLAVLEAVHKGEVEYAVLSIPAAEFHIEKQEFNLSRVSSPFWPRGYGFAVRKDNPELAEWIETNLNLMLTSDIYAEVYDKWKSRLEPQDKHAIYNLKTILLIIVPFAMLAFLSYMWSWSLKRQVVTKTKEALYQLSMKLDAENQILQKEAMFKTLVNSSPNAILIIENDGAISFANKQASLLFGWQIEELIGKPFDELIPDEFNQYHAAIQQRLARNDVVDVYASEHQFIAKTKHGNELNVEVTLSPVKINRDLMTMAIVRDVTAKLKIEEHLRQSQKMEAIGQLTGGVAHDFNNLLGVIIGNLDLLSSMYPADDKAQKRISGALKASLSGAELTKRLLAFARKQTLNPDYIDIGASLKEMLPILDRTMKGEVEIKMSLPESMSKVFIDNGEFENVILNMTINARDAMPKGGVLTIEVNEIELDDDFIELNDEGLSPGRYVHIILSDTGSGMPPEVIKHIFEPFYTTKEKGKGTGLGLAMAHGFVKQSKGMIRVYSEKDIGTTFHIYLPVAGEQEQHKTKSLSAVAELSEGDGETILIVDDETELAEIASAYLEGLGYKTQTVQSGEAALDLLAEDKNIALVLTDIIMPGGMDGVELHHRIYERFPSIKVVYASGFSADALTNKRGHELTADLVQKPYRRNDLANVIRKNLDTKTHLNGGTP